MGMGRFMAPVLLNISSPPNLPSLTEGYDDSFFERMSKEFSIRKPGENLF